MSGAGGRGGPDVAAVLATMLAGGFDRALDGLEVVEVGAGRARARLPVGEAVLNAFGQLHGGAVATLVDDIGSLAILAADRYGRAGVTTDLHVSYVAPGRIGDHLLVEAEVMSCGLSMAFVTVTVTGESRGRVVARGTMTKHLGAPPSTGAVGAG